MAGPCRLGVEMECVLILSRGDEGISDLIISSSKSFQVFTCVLNKPYFEIKVTEYKTETKAPATILETASFGCLWFSNFWFLHWPALVPIMLSPKAEGETFSSRLLTHHNEILPFFFSTSKNLVESKTLHEKCGGGKREETRKKDAFPHLFSFHFHLSSLESPFPVSAAVSFAVCFHIFFWVCYWHLDKRNSIFLCRRLELGFIPPGAASHFCKTSVTCSIQRDKKRDSPWGHATSDEEEKKNLLLKSVFSVH